MARTTHAGGAAARPACCASTASAMPAEPDAPATDGAGRTATLVGAGGLLNEAAEAAELAGRVKALDGCLGAGGIEEAEEER